MGGTTTGTFNSVTSGTVKTKVTSGMWTLAGGAIGLQHTISGGQLTIADGGSLKATGGGGLFLSGGTLTVNGTLEDSGAGAIGISAGATLKGTGVATNGVVASVPAGATIAPGDPTGTLTLEGGDCTIAGTLAITVNGAQNSALAVDGNLSVTSATLDVTVNTMPSSAAIIATYTTLDGPFQAITGGGNLTINYNYQGGNAIALVPPSAGTMFVFE